MDKALSVPSIINGVFTPNEKKNPSRFSPFYLRDSHKNQRRIYINLSTFTKDFFEEKQELQQVLNEGGRSFKKDKQDGDTILEVINIVTMIIDFPITVKLVEAVAFAEIADFDALKNFYPKEKFVLSLDRPFILSWFSTLLYHIRLQYFDFFEIWKLTPAVKLLRAIYDKSPYMLSVASNQYIVEGNNIIINMVIASEAVRAKAAHKLEFVSKVRASMDYVNNRGEFQKKFIRSFYILHNLLAQIKRSESLLIFEIWFKKLDKLSPNKESHFYLISQLANAIVLFYEDEKNKKKLDPFKNLAHTIFACEAGDVCQQAGKLWLMLPLINFKEKEENRPICEKLFNEDALWTEHEALSMAEKIVECYQSFI